MRHKYIVPMIVTIVCILLILCFVLLLTPAAAAYGVTTQRQDDLHATADALRAMGIPEDSAEIQALKALWWDEQERLNIVAKVIQNEADPQWCEWEHSVAVGAVVVNRERSPHFPDTVKEVVEQPGQYLAAYTRNFDGVSELAYLAAKAALDGDHDVPSDCYWQDTHVQGVSVWREFTVDTGYFRSTTYICCGIPGVD